MIRTQFAALALGLFIASPAVAQTNVAGDWDVTINSPQGANTSKVTFKQDATKLDGMIKSPAGETPIGGTIEADEVKVAFTINFQGMPFEIKLNGKLVGDTMAGKADFGGFAEGDWTAKRSGDAAAAAASTTTEPSASTTTAPSATTTGGGFGGRWDVTLKTPAGDFPANANLAVDGGKLTGTFGSQNPTRNLAPTAVWVIWWVGVAYLSALFGNVWMILNPWSALFSIVERSVGLERRFMYPPALGVCRAWSDPGERSPHGQVRTG